MTDPRTEELRAIMHKAFSHPAAPDDSQRIVGEPMLVKTSDGWYVLAEDGERFNLVSCMEPAPKMVEAAAARPREEAIAEARQTDANISADGSSLITGYPLW